MVTYVNKEKYVMLGIIHSLPLVSTRLHSVVVFTVYLLSWGSFSSAKSHRITTCFLQESWWARDGLGPYFTSLFHTFTDKYYLSSFEYYDNLLYYCNLYLIYLYVSMHVFTILLYVRVSYWHRCPGDTCNVYPGVGIRVSDRANPFDLAGTDTCMSGFPLIF